MSSGFFIASTGKNIGKTTLCLGLLAGLIKQGIPLTYMKPVGQEQELIEENSVFVDKDVPLIKEYFSLTESYIDMSPVLIPSGFTKLFLDEKINTEDLFAKISHSFSKLTNNGKKSLIVEGTGHVGVGSIIHLNNAEIAKRLGLPVILLASGGLGSAFDELSLNKALCDLHGTKILGVVLNRVKEEKKEMILHYMQKALNRWNLPLLGILPLDPLLSQLSLEDIAPLFSCVTISGEGKSDQHFTQIRLIASSVENFRETIEPGQLIITPAHREDIILATLAKHRDHPLPIGMILSGDIPPCHFITEELKKQQIPVLYTMETSHLILETLSLLTAKIRKGDIPKIEEAIKVVENSIDFSFLLRHLNS